MPTVPQVPDRRYIIAGGSGLIGRALTADVAGAGDELVVLTRSAQGYRGLGRAVEWTGQTLGQWTRELEGAAAIVNLAGRNVATRWTPEARRDILASRVNSARVIGEAIARCAQAPRVWINAGAVGIYGDRGEDVLDEASPPARAGSDFLGDVCRAWESAVNDAQVPSRKIITRFGVVFAPRDPALRMLVRVTRLFAGGRLGSGKQWMPWIHVEDVVRALRWAMDTESAAGTFNVTSPNPTTNADLMRELRRILHRPPAPPAPAWAARLAGKVIGLPMEPALASCRAVPRRLLDARFEFQHPELRDALERILRAAD